MGQQCMCTQQIQQHYNIVVRAGGSVVGVVKKKLFLFTSHTLAGVVLLLMYQQKYTAVYCCVKPTRATAGERRRASDVCAQSKYSSSIVVVRVGGSVVGVHNFLFYSRVTPWGGTTTKLDIPTKIYCCVLLCTTNENGGGRVDGGRARK